MKNLPGASEVLKRKYCRGGQYESCARYRVYKIFGKGNVPQDLSPTRIDIAEKLIAEKEVVYC
jgi:hypothetical protein